MGRTVPRQKTCPSTVWPFLAFGRKRGLLRLSWTFSECGAWLPADSLASKPSTSWWCPAILLAFRFLVGLVVGFHFINPPVKLLAGDLFGQPRHETTKPAAKHMEKRGSSCLALRHVMGSEPWFAFQPESQMPPDPWAKIVIEG